MPIIRNHLIDKIYNAQISISILATKAAVSEKTIYNIIYNKNTPSVELADKLATILKCSINDLFEFTYEEKLL